MQKKKVFLISSMHFFLDVYMGFFGVYLVIARLDPIKAALVATVAAFLGNILQPFMGYTADRIRGKLPLFTGLLLTPLSMSMIGLTSNYMVLFFLVLIGHIGSSLFHPAGSNVAGAVGLSKKDASFAIFFTIGTLGFAFSQPFFSIFTGWFDTKNSYLLSLPGVLLALSFLSFSRTEIHGNDEVVHFKDFSIILLKRLTPVVLLFFIMVFRSAFLTSLELFLAKTFEEWGFARNAYSSANTIFMISGAMGILLAGQLVRWIKPRILLFFSLIGFFPFFIAFIYFGISKQLIPAFIFLALSGFVLIGGHSSNIIMGHRVIPEMTSTISGILMGFAWAIASFGPTLCALLRSKINLLPGLSSGFFILTAFPLIASFLTRFLSKEVDG